MIFLQNKRVSVVESKTENTADREHAAFSTEKPNLGLPIFHHGSSKPTTLSQAKSSERHEKREKQTASPGARRDSVVVTINGEQAKGVVMLLLAINLASLFVSWLQYKYCESFGRHALVGPLKNTLPCWAQPCSFYPNPSLLTHSAWRTSNCPPCCMTPAWDLLASLALFSLKNFASIPQFYVNLNWIDIHCPNSWCHSIAPYLGRCLSIPSLSTACLVRPTCWQIQLVTRLSVLHLDSKTPAPLSKVCKIIHSLAFHSLACIWMDLRN